MCERAPPNNGCPPRRVPLSLRREAHRLAAGIKPFSQAHTHPHLALAFDLDSALRFADEVILNEFVGGFSNLNGSRPTPASPAGANLTKL